MHCRRLPSFVEQAFVERYLTQVWFLEPPRPRKPDKSEFHWNPVVSRRRICCRLTWILSFDGRPIETSWRAPGLFKIAQVRRLRPFWYKWTWHSQRETSFPESWKAYKSALLWPM